MYCRKCGKYLPDDSKYCGECGESFESVSYQQAEQPDNYIKQYPESYNRLGGWLAFFAYMQIVGIILNIVMGIVDISMLAPLIPYLSGWLIFVVVVSLLSYIVPIVFSARLFGAIRGRSPRFMRIYELQALVVFIMNLIILLMAGGDVTSNEITHLISSVVAFFIWTTYFRRSVRVRVYFGTDEYISHSIFFKNTQLPRV